MKRTTSIHRKTGETDIHIRLSVDGRGDSSIDTPIGFFNHMLASFSRHGLFDLFLEGSGDLEVDQHHLIEDCGILLGQAFDQALGNREAINRSGYFVYPMDDALAVVAVDIAGRPYLQFDVVFKRRYCGDMDVDLLEDFFQSVAAHMKANVVVRIPYGRSDHHKMEAVFKAFGKAMKMACARDPRIAGAIPSTKGEI